MLKKILTFIAFVFILFMLVTNFTILRFFLPQHYPLGSVMMDFERYKKETNQPNLVLYRCFYRKWWQVWNWADFLTLPCFDLPYAERDEDTCVNVINSITF